MTHRFLPDGGGVGVGTSFGMPYWSAMLFISSSITSATSRPAKAQAARNRPYASGVMNVWTAVFPSRFFRGRFTTRFIAGNSEKAIETRLSHDYHVRA